MSSTKPGVLNVRAKTGQVVEHHYDDAKPGKPLYLLVPGGLIALASLALIVYIGYLALYKGDMPSDQGLTLMAILAPFYIGGVFLFSYGYELYNVPKALRLTAIIVFITLACRRHRGRAVCRVERNGRGQVKVEVVVFVFDKIFILVLF